MNRTALAAGALLLLTPFAVAQLHPLPGMPMVPPPVPHPALGAQPFFQPPQQDGDRAPAPAPSAQPQPKGQPRPAPPPDVAGKKLGGKDLKQAVNKVKALRWLENMPDAKVLSAASGKPILWLQALGDIDGFA